jgi:hypothetical protein
MQNFYLSKIIIVLLVSSFSFLNVYSFSGSKEKPKKKSIIKKAKKKIVKPPIIGKLAPKVKETNVFSSVGSGCIRIDATKIINNEPLFSKIVTPIIIDDEPPPMPKKP